MHAMACAKLDVVTACSCVALCRIAVGMHAHSCGCPSACLLMQILPCLLALLLSICHLSLHITRPPSVSKASAAQICDAYNANRYPFPEEPARQRQMNGEVTARLRELHTTIEAGGSIWPAPQFTAAMCGEHMLVPSPESICISRCPSETSAPEQSVSYRSGL